MDIEMVVTALRRHWWASLLTLALAVVAVVVVPRQIRSEFQVSGDVILLSPSKVDGGIGGDVSVNPWSRFGGAETGAAAALVTVMSGASVKAELTEGDIETVDIGINRNNGAIIGITVTGGTPPAVLDGYRAVVEELDLQLRTRQAESGAAESTWLRLDALTVPSEAEELPGSRTRAMAAIAALGVVASVCTALVLDATVTARLRNRRNARGGRVLPPPHPDDAMADPGDHGVSFGGGTAWRRSGDHEAEVHVLNGKTRVANGGRRR